MLKKMRVAVVGGGIRGLVSAYVLAKADVEVELYEQEDYLGGHAKTVTFDAFDLDLGFMVFNPVTSIPEERYNEYRLSSDFIKEYIFPGACVASLSRITSAMASASRLSVEHVENIGIHFYRTLRCWRKISWRNKAGFKSRTLGNYQAASYLKKICTKFISKGAAPHKSVAKFHL